MKYLLPTAAAIMAILGCGCSRKSPGSVAAEPARPAVTTATAAVKSVPVDLRAVGNVEAYTTIEVKAQVGGQLTEVYFREGDFVKQGDPLFLIDPRPFDEAIRQIEANLARDRALLRQAEANLQRDIAQEKFARDQAARYQKLFAEGIGSRQQADQYSLGG
jgi:multidrug efflux system membrane fusion protein